MIPGATEHQQRKKVPKESSFGQGTAKEVEDIDWSNESGFLAYSDSCYTYLKGGGSQGGFIVFLTDADVVKLSSLAWEP